MTTAQRQYYTLVASLPHLARFDTLVRLPISADRLRDRLMLLHPDDRAVAESALDFLAWQRQPADNTDEAVLSHFRELRARHPSGLLCSFAEFRLTVRTVVAALRRQHSGQAMPRPEWGVPAWTAYAARHPAERNHRLEAWFPWVPRARSLLEANDTAALERLLMGLVWDHLGSLPMDHAFAFDAVLVYLFKWDIADRWLRQDESRAAARLEREIARTIAGHLGPYA